MPAGRAAAPGRARTAESRPVIGQRLSFERADRLGGLFLHAPGRVGQQRPNDRHERRILETAHRANGFDAHDVVGIVQRRLVEQCGSPHSTQNRGRSTTWRGGALRRRRALRNADASARQRRRRAHRRETRTRATAARARTMATGRAQASASSASLRGQLPIVARIRAGGLVARERVDRGYPYGARAGRSAPPSARPAVCAGRQQANAYTPSRGPASEDR